MAGGPIGQCRSWRAWIPTEATWAIPTAIRRSDAVIAGPTPSRSSSRRRRDEDRRAAAMPKPLHVATLAAVGAGRPRDGAAPSTSRVAASAVRHARGQLRLLAGARRPRQTKDRRTMTARRARPDRHRSLLRRRPGALEIPRFAVQRRCAGAASDMDDRLARTKRIGAGLGPGQGDGASTLRATQPPSAVSTGRGDARVKARISAATRLPEYLRGARYALAGGEELRPHHAFPIRKNRASPWIRRRGQRLAVHTLPQRRFRGRRDRFNEGRISFAAGSARAVLESPPRRPA